MNFLILYFYWEDEDDVATILAFGGMPIRFSTMHSRSQFLEFSMRMFNISTDNKTDVTKSIINVVIKLYVHTSNFDFVVKNSFINNFYLFVGNAGSRYSW